MLPRKNRRGLGRTALVVVAVLAVLVGAVVGVSVPRAAHSSSSTTSTSSTTTTPTSSSAGSSTGSTTSTASSSSVAVSSNTTAPTPPLAPPLFNFTLASEPPTMLIAAGRSEVYPDIVIVPAPNNLQGKAPANEGIGDELVYLKAVTPAGLIVHFFGSNLPSTFYYEAQPGYPSILELQVNASQSITPGNYPVTIEASSGTLSLNYSFSVQVVQYLIEANLNIFSPTNITVPVGSTVYWMVVDSNLNNVYNVIMSQLNVSSPALSACPVCSIFSYTFTTPGTYLYISTAMGVELGSRGIVNVTG